MTKEKKHNRVFGTFLALTVSLGTLSSGTWGQTYHPPPIDHPFPQANARFGWIASGLKLCINEVPGIAVGAGNQDVDGNADQGQVYLFVQDVNGFTYFEVLNHPDPQANSNFGTIVTNIGDITGDGRPDIAVGANSQDVGGNADQGSVFLFSGRTGAFIARLDHPTPEADSHFGSPIAGISDVNGDDVPDFAVAAHQQDVAGTNNAGRVFVFSGSDRSLLYTVDNPDLPDDGPQFGSGIIGMGDVNCDGIPDFAVGSPFYGGGPSNGVGRAYMFSGLDGTLLFKIFMPNPEANSIPAYQGRFANVGDVTGDGVADLAVGAHLKDAMGNYDQGQAWIFSGADGSLHCTLDDPIPQPTAHFGISIEGLGDVDGDGVPDIVVGAQIQDVGGEVDVGQGFVFSGATCESIATFDHPFPQPGPGTVATRFPSYFANVGDIDGNGRSDFLAAAPEQNVDGNNDQGQIYIFTLPELPCPADTNGDRVVNVQDFLNVLFSWFFGCPPPPPFLCGDVDGDGIVTLWDMLFVLDNWGPCP